MVGSASVLQRLKAISDEVTKTVSPKPNYTPLIDHTEEKSEKPPDRRVARAFCGNCVTKLSEGDPCHSVDGVLGRSLMKEGAKKSMVDCPDCGHALFWSKSWKEMTYKIPKRKL